MNKTQRIEFAVGAFMLVALIAIAVMLLKVVNVSDFGKKDTYQLKARFDNIGSLKVRAPVKVGGVVVGQISHIYLDTEEYIPIVTMTIGREFGEYPDTSSANILTSGLIGEQYISLVPGFMMDGIEVLDDGDFIEDTKSALVLEDLIGQFLYSSKGDEGSNDETIN